MKFIKRPILPPPRLHPDGSPVDGPKPAPTPEYRPVAREQPALPFVPLTGANNTLPAESETKQLFEALVKFIDAKYLGLIPSDVSNVLAPIAAKASDAARQQRTLRDDATSRLKDYVGPITSAAEALEAEKVRRQELSARRDDILRAATVQAKAKGCDPVVIAQLRGEAASLNQWLQDAVDLKSATTTLREALKPADTALLQLSIRHQPRGHWFWSSYFAVDLTETDPGTAADYALSIATRIQRALALLTKGEYPDNRAMNGASPEVPPLTNIPALRS
ncbi:MAG TPA: hypothetical protein VKV04_20320 [Verrucomicrobiae bacterium]|nr:hypothetical protein [Verrucomicrobiae bacterium]